MQRLPRFCRTTTTRGSRSCCCRDNFVNFMGRYVYIAADHALDVVVATEQNEPQAVMGSTLQKIAYPANYDRFVRGGSELKTFYEHVGIRACCRCSCVVSMRMWRRVKADCVFTTLRRSIRRVF